MLLSMVLYIGAIEPDEKLDQIQRFKNTWRRVEEEVRAMQKYAPVGGDHVLSPGDALRRWVELLHEAKKGLGGIGGTQRASYTMPGGLDAVAEGTRVVVQEGPRSHGRPHEHEQSWRCLDMHLCRLGGHTRGSDS